MGELICMKTLQTHCLSFSDENLMNMRKLNPQNCTYRMDYCSVTISTIQKAVAQFNRFHSIIPYLDTLATLKSAKAKHFIKIYYKRQTAQRRTSFDPSLAGLRPYYMRPKSIIKQQSNFVIMFW